MNCSTSRAACPSRISLTMPTAGCTLTKCISARVKFSPRSSPAPVVGTAIWIAPGSSYSTGSSTVTRLSSPLCSCCSSVRFTASVVDFPSPADPPRMIPPDIDDLSSANIASSSAEKPRRAQRRPRRQLIAVEDPGHHVIALRLVRPALAAQPRHAQRKRHAVAVANGKALKRLPLIGRLSGPFPPCCETGTPRVPGPEPPSAALPAAASFRSQSPKPGTPRLRPRAPDPRPAPPPPSRPAASDARRAENPPLRRPGSGPLPRDRPPPRATPFPAPADSGIASSRFNRCSDVRSCGSSS